MFCLQRKHLTLWVIFNIYFLRRGVVSTSSNPQAGGPPLVGCSRLLIQFIHSYPPYWRPFLHPQPEDAPYRGDRDPLSWNFTTTHTIYPKDAVQIHIHFFLMGSKYIRAMITKATVCHVTQPAVSQSQNHGKFTSHPSQVATSHKVSTSRNTLPSSAEVKNEWSYTLRPLNSKMAWPKELLTFYFPHHNL